MKLKSIFTKAIYERRLMLLGWGAGVTALTLLTISVFHSFSGGDFQTTLNQLPKALEGLVGSAQSYATINGFINQQIFVKAFPIFLSIFAVIIFSGVLAGEEGDGRLQVLLAQPVGRIRVVLEKFFAALLLCAVICLVVAVACLLVVPLISESVNKTGLFQAAFGMWLLICSFGSLSFMIGAVTGKRSIAGGVAGAFAFGCYMVSSLAVGVAGLRGIEKVSPFHYYGINTNLISDGLQPMHVTVLLSIILGNLLVSIVVFRKRDIYQK